ncbi:armadillo-type protein [Pelagophyceae sp. CCMP2097]|nr:armadillo-type protein [Pelagophyceae sp. CCMP2097]|mmetsp:Transcript_11153/g.38718  ORF Transcript_11153/g.38718 Transcript_11153/m.38718 type:complete len:664 (-) Transcript_11153:288-2279(-)
MAELLFDPFALLCDDLKSPKREVRLQAIGGLRAVARVVGPEKTRSHLIPQVQKMCESDEEEEEEDEVRFQLAKLLGDFVQEVGGPAHASILFASLRPLAQVDETVVWSAALKSLVQLFTSADAAPAVAEAALALTAALSQGEGFGSRASAAALCAPCAALLKRSGSDKRVDADAVLVGLLGDESPWVRKAAAGEISAYGVATGDQAAFSDVFAPLASTLLLDQHDAVRTVVVRQLSLVLDADDGDAFAAHAAELKARARAAQDACAESEAPETAPVQKPSLLAHDVCEASSVDKSWRVRDSLAKCIPGFARHCARNGVGSAQVLVAFEALLTDVEIDVRVTAISSAAAVAEAVVATAFVDEAGLRDIIAVLSRRVVQPLLAAAEAAEQKVRVAAARAMMRLVAVVAPREGCAAAVEADLRAVQRVVVGDVTGRLLADEHVEVLLATLDELADVVPTLERGVVADMVPAVVEKAEHHNWRIRKALTLALPAIAAQVGAAVFDALLCHVLVRSASDRICAVRAAAVSALESLRDLRQPEDEDAPLFDGDWLMAKVVTELNETYEGSYYIYRITVVQAYEKLLHAQLKPEHMEKLVLFLAEAAQDEVPNVRFTAVSALQTACRFASDKVVNDYIKPIFRQLKDDDADVDVQFHVQEALRCHFSTTR